MKFSMRYWVLILLMISFASAVKVDFDCPDDIVTGEEFECSLEVWDGEGVYDVKVDLNGERDSPLEIWNGDGWSSGYYYAKKFIENDDEKNVRLRISEEGDYDAVLKLRQDSKVEFFDVELEVEEGEEIEEVFEEVEEEAREVSLSKEVEVISLGGSEEKVIEEKEWDYVSKDGRVVDYLPYVFCLFLIFVIGILLWSFG